MIDVPYQLSLPNVATSCAVFNSGHSGPAFPPEFLESAELPLAQLRSSEDCFVDQLILNAPDCGAPLLAARFSRAYVDLNRAASELDPALIVGLPRQKTNPRIAVGLGVLPRVVAGGKAIQRGKISLEAAHIRLIKYYHPYHDVLARIINDQKQKFGMCLLFDFHSMPDEAVRSAPRSNGQPPHIILGDRFGTACDRWLIDAVEHAFVQNGFSVARNAPFAGGFITQNYGQPKNQVHAIQIEINRALYMDELSLTKRDSFACFQQRIANVVERISNLGPAGLKIAAE